MATQELTRQLGVPVSIGRVAMEWPNRVVLEQLYLEDQQGRELFKALHVSAGLDMMPLLEGKLVFTTVRLFSPTVHLSKPAPGEPLNLQFVIDAFARKDTVKKRKNIDLRFNGLIDLTQRLPVFDFDLAVKETNLHALHLVEGYPEAMLSFNGRTNMTGNSLDNINGFVSFDSIVFTNAGRRLDVDEIRFRSRTEDDFTDFSIASKYLNGSLSGHFKYTSLVQTAKELMSRYLPALQIKPAQRDNLNRIDIDLAISNTEDIAALFDAPYHLAETATIKGVLDESTKLLDMVISLPEIWYGTQRFNSTTLHLWGEPEQLEFIVESNMPTDSDYWNLALYTALGNGGLTANVEWRNRRQVATRGDFRTLTRFARDGGGSLVAHTSILPSEIVISDSLWHVSADSIGFGKGRVQVDNFLFGNNRQYLSIDGTASRDRQDSLRIGMKDVDLGFISTLAGMKGFHVGGITTGNALLRGVMQQPIFDLMLSVRGLQLNHTPVGDASIFSTWDQEGERVVAIASVMWLFAGQLYGLFSADPRVIALGRQVLLIEIFLEIGRSFNIVLVRNLQAVGDVRFPVLVGICSQWIIGVGLCYIFGILLNWGLPGMWLAFALDENLRGAIFLVRWKKGNWRNIKTV